MDNLNYTFTNENEKSDLMTSLHYSIYFKSIDVRYSIVKWNSEYYDGEYELYPWNGNDVIRDANLDY
jgi:hypothetical protein